MSIRRFVLTLPALVLVLALLAGVFPGGAAFAEGGGDPLALRFVCDETVASVTVYDPAGLPLPVGADGIHHLTPGTYFYSATAEGYESTGLQAFTIPADAAGDQELHISLTPVPGSVPPDASVPGQTPVNAPDPNAPEENPEDDGKLRIRPVDGSLTLTIERETRAESAVPPELQKLLEGIQKPLLTADGKPVEKKLWLKTPDAEELYLDRLAVEKALGYYTTDWTVLNLTDEEGSRKNLVPASGWYDVTVSGPATEPYRAYEPVFALVTLHWDEEGDIVDRDVQILETTHTPTKSSWSFSTDTLSTLVIAVPTDRPVESEEAAAKKDRPVFAASSTVDGVTVTVSAPAGVFPADAALWVQRVPLTEEIDAAVEAERGEGKTVAVSYTFDIRVVNPETMEEYQPEEGQSVSVSFALAEVADENLETRVYHVTEEESTGALTAEALDVSESGLTATAETDGFSYYQVEFTYEKLEYVLPGDTSVPLAEILAELGLSGDVTEVSCSNTNLFSCDWTENRWVVTAHRAFSSTEWMKVTLNNVVYEITVTDEWDQGFNFNDIGNGEAKITHYTGSDENVVIPETVTDSRGIEYTVTSIGDRAFSDNDTIKSVQIPSGVTSIGDYAFADCDSLQSIEIPSGVTSIGDRAFMDCESLTSVTFAEGSQLESIGGWAFYNCGSLGSITIPSGVTTIGAYAFSYCDSPYFSSITIPASVTSIGDEAFSKCHDLRYITFGGKLEQWKGLSPSSFIDDYDSGLITLYCTDSCGNDLSWKLENGTLTISGTGAMFDYELERTPWHYDGIFNLNIEEGVTSIGANAFWRFRLSRLVIPSGVTSIGENAFGDCSKLQNATIPASVRSIGDYAFFFCSPLEYICYVGTRENWDKISSSSYVHAGCKIIAACADLDDGGTVAFDTENGVTVTATPNSGYSFVNWTENGNVVTGEDGKPVGASYSFNVVADRNLVAHFVKPVSVNLQVTKEFNDWGKADSFTFNLAAVTEGAPMPANSTAVATEDETTASFGPITYDTAETYEYTITEVNGGADGVTYDTSAHKVVVTVSKDATTNALSAEVKYDGQPYLNVTNTFATTTATLQVTKSFNDWSKAPQGFTFTLAPVDNAPMPANNTTATATATKADPTAVFDEITYDKAGTYKYTITEVNGGADGVSYDTKPHNVVVTVSKDATTNALSAEVKYDGQDSLTVTNTFTPATAVLKVTKRLNPWRAGDSFTFTLAPVGNAPMPAKDTATATEQNKKATFDEIEYETAGRYEYTITETDGGKPNVTYDTKPHNVVVTVTKAEDETNALSAEVKYDEHDSLTVTNSRQFYDVDTSMTGGTVTATPASAAAGDTVTLTVTPDKGSELTSLTATNQGTGEVIDLVQDPNNPNLYSFVMPAAGVTVTATFKEILYTVVEGADSSWLKGSNGDLSIRVKRDPKDETCFQHFRNGGKGSVAIDGAVLSEDTSALIQKDYNAEAGSTVITLHKKMLNRLSAGKHTVTITFDDGSVSTGLTILVPAGGYSPGTGDSSRIGFWAALMVLAGLGFAGADYGRRRLRKPRYVGKH